MKLFFARHGQSNHNAQNRFSGHGNAKLTALGKKQAQAVGKRLSKKSIQVIFHSDLSRARDTARIIAKHIRPKPVLIETKALREMDMGIFEGKKAGSLPERLAAIEKKWRKNYFRTRLPKGENFYDVTRRAKPVLKEIFKSDYKNVLIVSHGGTTRVLLKLVLGLTEIEATEIEVENNCFFEVSFKDKKPSGFKKIAVDY
ncbi:MAG: histidine phosphatase family protein [Candidatus Diapherotrites archaeon]|nr:histidine phosphatase family protein [Candidatus Diapherotrites archaeon]